MERSFSTRERESFDQKKQFIKAALKKSRSCAEHTCEAAQEMARIDELGWWTLDGSSDRASWAEATFQIGLRQANKYFAIGAHLTPEQVRGTGLGVDVLYQVAQVGDVAAAEPAARLALMGVLLRLASEEGLGDEALGAGRRAAAALLGRGETERACQVAAERARARQVQLDGGQRPAAGARTPLQEAQAARRGLVRTAVALEAIGDAEQVEAQLLEDVVAQTESLLEQVRGRVQALRARLARPAEPPREVDFLEEAPAAVEVEAAPAVVAPVAVLQLPAEVLVLRPLLRLFHEELPVERQGAVQAALVTAVQGRDAAACARVLYQELRPYVPKGHPLKPALSRLSAELRAKGVVGRRFALHCLVGARLPGLREWLGELCQAELPAGLLELCGYYHGLLAEVPPC